MRDNCFLLVKIEDWDIYIYFLFNMELPEDILSVIREFSRPVTHPGWRGLHLMNELKFLKLIANTYNEMNFPVIIRFVHRYENRENNYIYHRFIYNPTRIVAIYLKIENNIISYLPFTYGAS